jgi:glycosyltransferase involved in cell wall biosynthesis
MRACFFIPSLDGGGAQRQCIALVNALQHTSGVEVHLILLGRGVHDDSLDVSRLHLHCIEVRNFASPLALAFVVRTLRRVRPDLLISFLHPADIWSYAATRVVRGVPWVMTERDSVYPDNLMFHLRFRFGRRASAGIIANSQAGKRLWESLAPHSPVQMIPNMVLDSEIPSGPSGVDRTTSVECLYVGRLHEQKNVSAMTNAFTHFAAAHSQAKLVLAGKGASRPAKSSRGTEHSQAAEVLRIAESGGVASRVELLGFRKDVPTLMYRARVFLSFSRHEGMPNVVMEAVVAGLPAVVSDIPEHRALLGDDYPYYVRLDAPPEDAASVIAQAWASDLTASEQAYAYARGVLATMTPEKVVGAYLDVFAEVTARANTTGTRPREARRGVSRP